MLASIYSGEHFFFSLQFVNPFSLAVFYLLLLNYRVITSREVCSFMRSLVNVVQCCFPEALVLKPG